MLKYILAWSLLLSSAAFAQGEPKIIESAGSWIAYSIGQPPVMCGTAVMEGVHKLHIKQVAREPMIRLQMFQEKWDIKSRDPIPLELRISENKSWIVNAYPIPGRSAIEFALAGEDLVIFSLSIAEGGQSITLSFLDDSDQPWNFSLDGSRSTYKHFINCSTDMWNRTNPKHPLEPQTF